MNLWHGDYRNGNGYLSLREHELQFAPEYVEASLSGGIQFTGFLHVVKVDGDLLRCQWGWGADIPIPQYSYLNYAVMPGDRTNNLQIAGIAMLPFGKDKQFMSTGIASAVAGGWQLNAILGFYSGAPFSVSADGTSLNAQGSTQRANQIKPSVAITSNGQR